MAKITFVSLLISALVCVTSATFNINSKNNVAVYYVSLINPLHSYREL